MLEKTKNVEKQSVMTQEGDFNHQNIILGKPSARQKLAYILNYRLKEIIEKEVDVPILITFPPLTMTTTATFYKEYFIGLGF